MFAFEHRTDGLHLALDVQRFDLNVSQRFMEQALSNIPSGIQRISIDMSDVEFIDSSGLGVLVAIKKRLGEHGVLEIVGLSKRMHRIFELTKLGSLFSFR